MKLKGSENSIMHGLMEDTSIKIKFFFIELR